MGLRIRLESCSEERSALVMDPDPTELLDLEAPVHLLVNDYSRYYHPEKS